MTTSSPPPSGARPNGAQSSGTQSSGMAAARPRHDSLGFPVEALRTRPWARRALSVLSVVLLLVGIGMLAWPFATNLYQDRLQSRLDRQLASPSLRQAYRERRIQIGDSLTRIRIPALGVD